MPFNAVHAPHQVPDSYKQPYAHLKEPRRTYAGMTAALDEAVGTILAALDETRMRPNTLIRLILTRWGPASDHRRPRDHIQGQQERRDR